MKQAKIHIPKPCAQQWEDLTPEQGGRYCSSCQQMIVDFTQMSDQEIGAYLKAHTGKICGRITVFPANRPINGPKKSKRSPRAFRFAISGTRKAGNR